METALPSRSGAKHVPPPAIATAAIQLVPVTLLSAVVILLACSLASGPRLSLRLATTSTTPDTHAPDAAPSLADLLATVADALDAHDVPFWLPAGTGLLPPSKRAPHAIGALSPWQEGVDLAVNRSHLMQILLTHVALAEQNIDHVESYFGARIFHRNGYFDSRYDYTTPFVDLIYFSEDVDDRLSSFCCDCEPVVIGACSKKTCGCLICTSRREDIFPLRQVVVEGVPQPLPAVRNLESLLLPRGLDGVHPSVDDMLAAAHDT